MAIRQEDLMSQRDAVVLSFPGRDLRATLARRRRMQVRRRRSSLVAVVVVLTGLFLLATGPGGSSPASAPGTPRAITIHHGDTLWGVAEEYAPEGVDLRAYVDLLEDLNDVEGGLSVGMRLELPR